jgi:hypothetical protein
MPVTINYPASLDTAIQPGSSTYTDDAGFELDVMIDTLMLAMAALEAKVGVGASVAAANRVLRGTGAGATAFGQIQAGDHAAGAISGADIAALGVAAGKYAAGSIATADIANHAATQISSQATAGGSTASASPVELAHFSFTVPSGVTEDVFCLADFAIRINTVGVTCTLGAKIDSSGITTIGYAQQGPGDANYVHFVGGSYQVYGVTAGVHTIYITWQVSSGAATVSMDAASGTLVECRR